MPVVPTSSLEPSEGNRLFVFVLDTAANVGDCVASDTSSSLGVLVSKLPSSAVVFVLSAFPRSSVLCLVVVFDFMEGNGGIVFLSNDKDSKHFVSFKSALSGLSSWFRSKTSNS
jgi:hypothetical protein